MTGSQVGTLAVIVVSMAMMARLHGGHGHSGHGHTDRGPHGEHDTHVPDESIRSPEASRPERGDSSR